MLAVAACLLMLGGLFWLLRPQNDDPAQAQAAERVQEETVSAESGVETDQLPADDGEGSDAADEDDTGGAAAPEPAGNDVSDLPPPPPVDLSQIVGETLLPLPLRAAGGSPVHDTVTFAWADPSLNQRCDGAPDSERLISLDSSGVLVGRDRNGVGSQLNLVEGSDRQVALYGSCNGSIELVGAGRFDAEGVAEIRAFPSAPSGLEFSSFAPILSHGGTELFVHVEDAAGVLSVAAYDLGPEASREPVVETATGRLLGQFPNAVFVIATSQAVSIEGEQILDLDPDEGGARSVLAEMSSSADRVAVAAGSDIVIAASTGVVDRFSASGSILAMDWSPTGQLLFSTDEGPALGSYDPSAPEPFGVAFEAEGLWTEIEFADAGSTVALSGRSTDGVPEARIVRVGSASAQSDAAGEETPRPFGTLDVTVGEQPLALRGIGVIEAGMTVAEAEAAVGGTFVQDSAALGCRHAVLAGDPLSPRFMLMTYEAGSEIRDVLPPGLADELAFDQGIVVRIELDEGAQTISGIGIGSTRDEVIAAYGARIETAPHPYDPNNPTSEYLTFVPATEADSGYRLVMETIDDTVVAVRSGLVPFAGWVEGCS